MSFTTHREQLEAAEQRCAQARDMADKWREKAEELAACALRIIEERDIARALCAEAAAMLRNFGPVGDEFCWSCYRAPHRDGCKFASLAKRLEEAACGD